MKKITIMSLVMMAMLIIISCSKDDDVTDGNHGNDGGGGSPIVTVVINEDGTTSNRSAFSVIDEKNFYLDYIKYTIEEGHLIVSGYDQSGFKGVANIVDRITYGGDTYKVLKIGRFAFYDCTSLTSLNISNSIKSIGERAFHYCPELTSVTFGNSVTSIGESAFFGCSGLTSVTIPPNMSRIEITTFEGCDGLTSVTIPKNITFIGGGAFGFCSRLTSIVIEATMPPTTLPSMCMYSDLVTIYVPKKSLELYKNTSPWNDEKFFTLKPIEEKER